MVRSDVVCAAGFDDSPSSTEKPPPARRGPDALARRAVAFGPAMRIDRCLLEDTGARSTEFDRERRQGEAVMVNRR
jgi:hypothetical protein